MVMKLLKKLYLQHFEEWELPPLSCKYTTSDTCIINRDIYPDHPRDLNCSRQYQHCQIEMAVDYWKIQLKIEV